MKLEFDNLAVYAASIGVWKPIQIEWDALEILVEGPGPSGYHTWDFDWEDSDREPLRHIIGLAVEEPLEWQLRALRHELEHARQVEEIGGIQFESSYQYERVQVQSRFGTAPTGEEYATNLYEREALAVEETEWQDLLPCVKGAT